MEEVCKHFQTLLLLVHYHEWIKLISVSADALALKVLFSDVLELEMDVLVQDFVKLYC